MRGAIFCTSQGVVGLYPEAWQARARLARAETGLAQGDVASASDALDQLPASLSPRNSVEARLYAAELLAVQGRTNEAISRLTALERTDYPPVAARATLFPRRDAAPPRRQSRPTKPSRPWENLRYRWRGDELGAEDASRVGQPLFRERSLARGFRHAPDRLPTTSPRQNSRAAPRTTCAGPSTIFSSATKPTACSPFRRSACITISLSSRPSGETAMR